MKGGTERKKKTVEVRERKRLEVKSGDAVVKKKKKGTLGVNTRQQPPIYKQTKTHFNKFLF